jgi:ribosomal protein S18 acetylase RimI-like enzyme
MLDDYAALLKDHEVHVATQGNQVVGVIVLSVTDEGFYVDNVAVRPSVKGKGVGRQLLELAEEQARHKGFKSVYLATHVQMTENQALYRRIGYVPYDERTVNGFPRVFMRKALV